MLQLLLIGYYSRKWRPGES